MSRETQFGTLNLELFISKACPVEVLKKYQYYLCDCCLKLFMKFNTLKQ